MLQWYKIRKIASQILHLLRYLLHSNMRDSPCSSAVRMSSLSSPIEHEEKRMRSSTPVNSSRCLFPLTNMSPTIPSTVVADFKRNSPTAIPTISVADINSFSLLSHPHQEELPEKSGVSFLDPPMTFQLPVNNVPCPSKEKVQGITATKESSALTRRRRRSSIRMKDMSLAPRGQKLLLETVQLKKELANSRRQLQR